VEGEHPLSGWDVATRYHEFKKTDFAKRNSTLRDHVRAISLEAILERAKALMGRNTLPEKRSFIRSEDLSHPRVINSEVDYEETLEENPALSDGEFIYQGTLKKPLSLILTMDTSLSMTGEKLAFEALALAIVMLQFQDEELGVVCFEHEAQVLKRPNEKISAVELLSRFLDVKAEGYTNLEKGLLSAVSLASECKRPPSCVLLTDGKYTAGKDPAYLGMRFSHLDVIRVGKERAGSSLCADLAKKGNGELFSITHLEEIPSTIDEIIKALKRGRI